MLGESPTISNWHCSTSCTSSGYFPAAEVTLHIPRTSLQSYRSACLGPWSCLPHSLQITQPLSLQVVCQQGGGSMLFFPHKLWPPDTCHQAPLPGLALEGVGGIREIWGARAMGYKPSGLCINWTLLDTPGHKQTQNIFPISLVYYSHKIKFYLNSSYKNSIKAGKTNK